jgi:Putative beta-barrel porin-2, OmpL-like. bbp2
MSAQNFFRGGRKFLLLAAGGLVLSAGLRADASAASGTDTTAQPTAAPTATYNDFMGYTDFSWLNGNSRWTDNSMIDTKWFTPQIIIDCNYSDDFDHPNDHTVSGSTAIGRSDEFQLQQLGVGGDMHIMQDNGDVVRGRIMTSFGMDSTMVPRDDETPYRGEWNLQDAYQYIAEGYGGYHWNVMHGINLDAGIFPSYVGLYSYYNTENWTYQASYVSSNTPWFFNGMRLQIFPTENFKSEWWLINGWQTYGMFNDKLGVGYEQKYATMDGNFCAVFNGYAGADAPDSPDLLRLHSDNSFLYRDYQAADPKAFISRNAWSLTADIGGEQGSMWTGSTAANPSGYTDVTMGPGYNEEAFFGAMLYNRTTITDKFAFTFGGGFVNNPGQYLILAPPVLIQTGEYAGQAATGGSYGAAVSEYDTNPNPHAVQNIPDEAPGSSFIGKDFQIAFDYTPNQYLLYRIEYVCEQTNQPYYTGPNGISGPDGWGEGAQTGGGPGNSGYTAGTTPWEPDLVKMEQRIDLCMEIEI